jgi:hypothetical protein
MRVKVWPLPGAYQKARLCMANVPQEPDRSKAVFQGLERESSGFPSLGKFGIG